MTTVVGLWVTPSLPESVLRGEQLPPYIDHDDVDWVGLLGFLRDTFNAEGYGVQVRVADDTIDGVVLQLRESGELRGSLACEDFAGLLLERALETSKELIPIRREWEPLHWSKDRTQAPPPCIIPFVLSGDAVEVLLYIRQIQTRLCVKAAYDMVSYVETPPDALPEDFYQGYLFPEFVGQLEESFGVPFARPSIVQIMLPIDPSMI